MSLKIVIFRTFDISYTESKTVLKFCIFIFFQESFEKNNANLHFTILLFSVFTICSSTKIVPRYTEEVTFSYVHIHSAIFLSTPTMPHRLQASRSLSSKQIHYIMARRVAWNPYREYSYSRCFRCNKSEAPAPVIIAATEVSEADDTLYYAPFNNSPQSFHVYTVARAWWEQPRFWC